MPNLKLHVFGAFRVEADGRPIVSLPTRRTEELLARLALGQGRPLSRRAVATEIWWNTDETAAMASLRKSLSFVRKTVGSDAVDVSEGRLALGSQVQTDLDEVERALQRIKVAGTATELATALSRVDSLTKSDLLESWDELWITPFRDEWSRKRVGVLAELADFYRQHGQPELALRYTMRCADGEPLSEAHAARVIGLLAELDRHSEAEDYYRAFSDRLESELDLNVSASLTALARDVRMRSSSRHRPENGVLALIAQKVFQDEPGRLVSILASQGLSWVVYSHANEVFPVALRALEATSGWDPDRRRLAIDTIQLANFLGRTADLDRWLAELSQGVGPDTYEQAVCQCMKAITDRRLPIDERSELCHKAMTTARALGNAYMETVVSTSLAGILVEVGRYQEGLALFDENIAKLESDTTQRGQKYFATTLAGTAHLWLLLGDPERAVSYLERALVIESVAGVSDLESGNRATLGYLHVVNGQRSGLNDVTQSLAATIRQRSFRTCVQAMLYSGATLSALGLQEDADRMAGTCLDLMAQFGVPISYHERDFLTRFAHVASPSTEKSLLREMSLPSLPGWLAQH